MKALRLVTPPAVTRLGDLTPGDVFSFPSDTSEHRPRYMVVDGRAWYAEHSDRTYVRTNGKRFELCWAPKAAQITFEGRFEVVK